MAPLDETRGFHHFRIFPAFCYLIFPSFSAAMSVVGEDALFVTFITWQTLFLINSPRGWRLITECNTNMLECFRTADRRPRDVNRQRAGHNLFAICLNGWRSVRCHVCEQYSGDDGGDYLDKMLGNFKALAGTVTCVIWINWLEKFRK